jgi:hypothetical protein
MVLPLTRCPAAAGQGVLAVECRAGDAHVLELLRGVHDPATAELAAREDAALGQLPPALRNAAGATAVMHGELGPVCFVRGSDGDESVEQISWQHPPPPGPTVPFDGIAWQRACGRRAVVPPPDLAHLGPGSAVFVAYWHALQHQALPDGARIWVSGVESWRRLAALRYWVEGCGDNLGFADVRGTLECPVLQLPPLRDWTALTYAWAVPGWRESGVGRVVATYDILPPADDQLLAELRAAAGRATHFYWSSPEQFQALRTALPAAARHACGAGKTLRSLRAAGTDAQPFPNGREWRRWLAS